MAYFALVSLEQTIQRLLNSSPISFLPSSRKILDSVCEEAKLLQLIFFKISDDGESRKMSALDKKMRETAFVLEDALETHVVDIILSKSDDQEICLSSIPLDLRGLKQYIDSFSQIAMEVKEYIIEDDDEDDNDDIVTSGMDNYGGKKSKMVGFSDVFRQIKDLLPLTTIDIISLVGMAGIGKTTLTKEVFEDPSISTMFDHHAWVNVGPKHKYRDVLQCILSQVNPDIDIDRVLTQEANDLVLTTNFRDSLKNGRYLIVLDDVWELEQFFFILLYIRNLDKYRIQILLTTRLDNIAFWPQGRKLKLRFLNKEESWDLLREKVFGEEDYLCPRQLEKAGKKIAENCEGLPLTIVTIADILSKAEKTKEYWNEVAERKNSVFTDAYDRMSKVLNPSYKYLPQDLKACFLYMAVFPQNYDIPISKLAILWAAEGLVEPNPSENLEDYSLKRLEKLIEKSLVVVRKSNHMHKLKTCGLHSVFWHLCMRKAGRIKFSHVLKRYADSKEEVMKGQRRLCIHNNNLFSIKDVNKLMASISTARSLLCTGPYLQYQVPICFGHLRLLRVIDALTIRFYEFPMEVLELVQLRYLALIYDGKLPATISKLRNLQFFIIRRHCNIIKVGHESYLPMEIWDMKELKHLQVMGSDLADPHGVAFLPKLLTLLDVSARSCTKGVFYGLPNIQKLGIRIELPLDANEPLSLFDHISKLNKLESLKCVVVNPKPGLEVIAPISSNLLFPRSLHKLSLSGLGYPWEDMRMIASLPNLRVLKLRGYAFRGPEWEIKESDFRMLSFLLIEDTDLVNWKIDRGFFSRFRYISLKNCYKLEEIHSECDEYYGSIEMVDCNPLAVNCAKQMQKNNSPLEYYGNIVVNVHCSWNDEKLKNSELG